MNVTVLLLVLLGAVLACPSPLARVRSARTDSSGTVACVSAVCELRLQRKEMNAIDLEIVFS